MVNHTWPNREQNQGAVQVSYNCFTVLAFLFDAAQLLPPADAKVLALAVSGQPLKGITKGEVGLVAHLLLTEGLVGREPNQKPALNRGNSSLGFILFVVFLPH